MSEEIPQEESHGTTRLFQITEDDLAELERILPDICRAAIFNRVPVDTHGETVKTKPRLRNQVEMVRRIISNVRWDYGPPTEVGSVPA